MRGRLLSESMRNVELVMRDAFSRAPERSYLTESLNAVQSEINRGELLEDLGFHRLL